ncbi:MAG TPA: hypothetical protein ENI62_10110 [Gammaproteobacteria bacterium]|nr:hypothetical protein [Gammaproteobacteria bacterium]
MVDSSSRTSGGGALVQALVEHDVDTVFAIPGVQLDHLFNAFYDARDRIRVVHCRHEQAAGYMAFGYAAATGRPGVCVVVPGPGLLNASAALATAYARCTPVLCVVGQIPSWAIGRDLGMLHELPDQLAVARGVTKWAVRIEDLAETPTLVGQAFREMHSGRPGPVEIEMAMDIMAGEAKVPTAVITEPTAPAEPNPKTIAAAADLLAAAVAPLIVVGGGALEASAPLRRIAEHLHAPVVGSRSGRGVLSGRHELAINHVVAHRLWASTDVVLAAGTRFALAQQWGTDDELAVVRVDTDSSRTAAPQLGITGDAVVVLEALANALAERVPGPPKRAAEVAAIKAEVATELATLEPQQSYIRVLREALPDDGIFVEELTQIGYVARMTYPVYQPRTYITPGYQGTLGFGYPTALGAKVAFPQRRVLSISGDGGFMYNVGELASAARHGIAVVAVVFTDGAFGNVKRMQQNLYDGRVIATDLHNPNFVELARSFGIAGYRAESPEALARTLERAFDNDAPALIEVPLGEVPDPWGWILLPRVRSTG